MSLRRAIGLRLLVGREHADNFERHTIESVLDGDGVMYKMHFDDNPEGAGFRVKPIDPRSRGRIVSCNFFLGDGGVYGPPGSDEGLYFFVDRYEMHHAIERREWPTGG